MEGPGESPNLSLRSAYCEKLSKVQLAPCAHIAVVLSNNGKLGAASGVLEHHAVLDIAAKEVIHYLPHEEHCQVQLSLLQAFEEDFGSWRVVALPRSPQHGQEVLERARSKVGEEGYNLISNNCEHFVTWCFDESASSTQLWSMGANVASSAKGGVVAGMLAASATTTVTTPWYFLGIIPWGTTTATVPTVGAAGAVGIGAAAFVGWVGIGLGVSYGINKWAENRNTEFAEFLPIAVFNCSDQEVVVEIENLNSSSSYYSSRVDDIVHDTRAYLGVGQRKLCLGSGIAGELNPPAEDSLFHKFLLRVSVKTRDRLGLSFMSSFEEISTAEVRRGDVLIFRDSKLEQVPETEVEVVSPDFDEMHTEGDESQGCVSQHVLARTFRPLNDRTDAFGQNA